MKISSKDKILEEAYKLFATKTYDQVTYQDLEIKTHFTRGGLIHHIKSKNNLFKEVFDKYMLSETTILKSLEQDKNGSLRDFIDAVIKWIKKIKLDMLELGIENYNWAHVNLTYQAKFYYPDFISQAKKWEEAEINIWANIISNAIEHNEIKKDCNVELLANNFHNLYIGYSYSGIALPNGVDTEKLEKAMIFLYSTIKCNK